jgi:hypothetical protein
MRIHTAKPTASTATPTPDQPLELTGPLQIVFCDRDTASTDP